MPSETSEIEASIKALREDIVARREALKAMLDAHRGDDGRLDFDAAQVADVRGRFAALGADQSRLDELIDLDRFRDGKDTYKLCYPGFEADLPPQLLCPEYLGFMAAVDRLLDAADEMRAAEERPHPP